MKFIKLSLSTLLLFIFGSCDSDRDFEQNVLEVPQEAPKLELSMTPPEVSLEAIHVIQREFTYKVQEGGVTASGLSKIEYVEKRLIDLYPDKVYPGMLVQLNEEVQDFLEKTRAYHESIGILEEETLPLETLEDVIEHTQMTDEEIKRVMRYERLAQGKTSPTLLDIESISKGGDRSETKVITSGAIVGWAVLVGVPIVTSIVTDAVDRVNNLAEEYYDNHDDGTRGDAFTHILMSVYMRRYLGPTYAALVMQARELILSPNDDRRDMAMDLHNNELGFAHRYEQFRGNIVLSWDYRKWGSNIRSFMSPCSSGLAMDRLANWKNRPDMTLATARSTINARPNSHLKYVYYERTCDLCVSVRCAPGYACQNGQCLRDASQDVCPNVPCPSGMVCNGSGRCIAM